VGDLDYHYYISLLRKGARFVASGVGVKERTGPFRLPHAWLRHSTAIIIYMLPMHEC